MPVLDAAAIGISFVMGDFATASSTMFLLDLGETLEDYTRARSENQLIYSLLGAPENAQLVCGDEEMTVPTANLKAGDLIALLDVGVHAPSPVLPEFLWSGGELFRLTDEPPYRIKAW